MAHTTPQGVYAMLGQILGATLIGAWLPEDLAITSGTVTSWPSRIGPTASSTTHQLDAGILRGRTCIVDTDTTTFRFLTTSSPGTVRCAIVIAQANGLPFATTRSLLQGTTESPLWPNAASYDWYEAGTLVHYKNGVRQTTIDSDLAIWQADMPDTAMGTAGYIMGRGSSATSNFLGSILVIIYASSVPSEATRLALIRALAPLFQIPI